MMKASKYQLFIVALFSIMLLASCVEEMDISLGSTYKRLVVDGVITTDTAQHYVRLAESADYFYNKPLEPVRNAIVEISDGTNSVLLTESAEKPGWYYTQPDYFGVEGKTYYLTINNVDIDKNGVYETYTSKCFLRPVVQPDSINLTKSNRRFVDYEVRYFGLEPSETSDYYLFKLRINGALITDTLTETFPSDDVFYNGHLLKNVVVYNLKKDKTDENVVVGDTVTLEISNITKEYYQFMVDLHFEENGADPFGGQPANVSTNIEDKKKAIGFFAAYSIKRAGYIVKEKDLKK
jgi:hypothetical protein